MQTTTTTTSFTTIVAHTEYEPIVANDRIHIATNGSLIIKHADKNDEANYLCKSVNGIGQGLSATTKLRVNGKFQQEHRTLMFC